jgi:hypothetical protein
MPEAGFKASATVKQEENRVESFRVSAGVRRHLRTTGGQPIRPTIPLSRHRRGCRLTRLGNLPQIPKKSRRFVRARELRVLGVELRRAQKFLPVLEVLREIQERSAFPGHAPKLESEPVFHCLPS